MVYNMYMLKGVKVPLALPNPMGTTCSFLLWFHSIDVANANEGVGNFFAFKVSSDGPFGVILRIMKNRGRSVRSKILTSTLILRMGINIKIQNGL